MDSANAASAEEGGSREASISVIGVVDDDESVRDALSSLLRSVGYECEVFPSAEAFLDSDRRAATDCMLLDIKMPGISGLDLQARLRDMWCPAPVIFITGYTDEDLRHRAFQQGAVEFLGKPFSEEALLDAIRAALNGGGSHRPRGI